MYINPPVILEKQVPIIKWAEKLRNNHISVSVIIKYLTSNEKSGSHIIDDKLEEIQKLYSSCNSSWRDQILLAILLKSYRLENDIKEGQIVHNDKYVGFAFNVDYERRSFDLYADKNRYNYIDMFVLDDFKPLS